MGFARPLCVILQGKTQRASVLSGLVTLSQLDLTSFLRCDTLWSEDVHITKDAGSKFGGKDQILSPK